MDKGVKSGSLTKFVLTTLGGLGAGFIATQFIRGNVKIPTKVLGKIMYTLGASALSGVVSVAADKYISTVYDEVVDLIKTIKEKFSAKQEEEEILVEEPVEE